MIKLTKNHWYRYSFFLIRVLDNFAPKIQASITKSFFVAEIVEYFLSVFEISLKTRILNTDS